MMYRVILLLLLCIAYAAHSAPQHAAEGVSASITVPMDYQQPGLGGFPLRYELGRPFDATKPTVCIVADGQQFFLSPGSVAKLQEKWFDDRFNVVGIPGRMYAPELAQVCSLPDGGTNWLLAYRLYNSRQWCRDIDAVRQHLLGKTGRIMLFGGSGGGYLILEYLSRFHAHVKRAFIYSTPIPPIDASLGILKDTFPTDVAALGSDYTGLLQQALVNFADQRPDLVMLLSRQHYFHTADELPKARRDLLCKLADGDREAFSSKKEAYQVNAINNLFASSKGPAIRVRMYEFIYPVLQIVTLDGEMLYPTLEMERNSALPVLQLCEQGKIAAPEWDVQGLRAMHAELFVLTAAHDKAASLMSHNLLVKGVPKVIHFVAKDDHILKSLTSAGLFHETVRTFLIHGMHSNAMTKQMKKLETYRARH